jgi:hypothetical protein
MVEGNLGLYCWTGSGRLGLGAAPAGAIQTER